MGEWRKNVREVTPYIPGEQPQFADMIKLNTNENPYPPAPGVAKVLASMDAGRLKLYPKPDARELVDALAEIYTDCDVEMQYGGQPLYYYLIAVE